MLQYTLSFPEPHTHLFHVELELGDPDPAGVMLSLPVWIPGSYLVREFARHIVRLEAEQGGSALPVRKVDKHRWQLMPEADAGSVRIRYQVYAYDLSVRGAYLDQFRAFFNGTSVFLAVLGREQESCRVDIRLPVQCAHWQIATGLRPLAAGGYEAYDYDELIDCPVEIAQFQRLSFKACDVPHEFILSGAVCEDAERLVADVKAICEYQIRFWGAPAPFSSYHFLTMVTADGYGGLEHRNSTALLCSRQDLPQPHETARKQSYRQLLGLISHEYFHTWLVKRIKPMEFVPYDLAQENYTRQLWLFEGVTSYYDDLLLLRSGLITADEYLETLSQTITAVWRNPGSAVQTLEEASLDAWIKYYRQDENSPNSLVSYYTKGALVALCTDLLIRKHSGGTRSLDDVMRALWLHYGQTGLGVPPGAFEQLATQQAGEDLSAFFELALRSSHELPLRELLAEQGIEWQQRQALNQADKGGWLERLPEPRAGLGIKVEAVPEGLKVVQVPSGSAAERAGLAAGDVIMAVENHKVGGESQLQFPSARQGEGMLVHAFRRNQLHCLVVVLQCQPELTIGLRSASGLVFLGMGLSDQMKNQP
ncbi:M61 family metallopeptidase [Chitinilyticum piscinae]|uniref:M61 family metallopeptidase n=1 Tax=Chitinilyticum piscinae TaxID=2866724 RepID=A0A8J7K265_9NEIS|nr:PDZ domain-containing protein [Chitinilyticum piscinae]MBE9610136.1 M61 family metallopeptidase [Chitinilyticum piscinae]